MITYVNDVFVSNETGALYAGNISDLTVASKGAIAGVGKIVVANADGADAALTKTTAKGVKSIKIGLITNKVSTVVAPDGSVKYTPIVDWSNPIDKKAIKSINTATYAADKPESVKADFTKITSTEVLDKLKVAGHSIVFRIVYKDLNTRFRKWTESYEYITKEGDTPATISAGIAKLINKDKKRARVAAADAAGVLTVTALPYDDDDSVNSISPAGTVRFSVAVWVSYKDETGITSLGWSHKHPLRGLEITKTPGEVYTASAKYVRDREAAAMGYDGIFNRGMSTLRETNLPEMNVKLNGKYDAITIQFERLYRSADDLHRLTKECVEIYPKSGESTAIKEVIDAFVA